MTDVFRNDIIVHEVDLPLREFFYTLDQIAYMLDLDQKVLEKDYIWYQGREYGAPNGRIIATNIAAADAEPNWRVAEVNFMRWMKARRIGYDKTRAAKVLRRKKTPRT